MGQTPVYQLPWPELTGVPADATAALKALAERVELVLQQIAAVPTGRILIAPNETLDTGYLWCDGAAHSRTTYAALWAKLTPGTRWGAGDGSTTFNVPNLRGVMPVGLDAGQVEFDTIGEKAGAKTVLLTAVQSGVKAHGHGISDPGHSHALPSTLLYGDGVQNWFAAGAGNAIKSRDGSTGGFSGVTVQNHAGEAAGAAHENLPPYVVVNFVIKT